MSKLVLTKPASKVNGRLTKYTKEMSQRAYNILASGGTHAMVCKELGISEETFYQWIGRGSYRNSPYIKEDFSESIGRGEVASRAWFDSQMIKAATEKCDGNPNILIQMVKRKEFLSRVMPILRKTSLLEKVDALNDLGSTNDIHLETYEHALHCLEKQAYVIEKAKAEEFEKELRALAFRVNNIDHLNE